MEGNTDGAMIKRKQSERSNEEKMRIGRKRKENEEERRRKKK